MQFLFNLLLVVQVLSALAMIGLILVQHGKGADMGAAFGGGASGSLFGASGSANFLSRSTAVLATVFFVSTLVLAYYGNARHVGSSSVLSGYRTPAVAASAAAPVDKASANAPSALIPGNAPTATASSAASASSTAATLVPGNSASAASAPR